MNTAGLCWLSTEMDFDFALGITCAGGGSFGGLDRFLLTILSNNNT